MTSKTKKNRWFVRRGSTVKGPFLEAHITQYLLLGRVRDDDELSQDEEDWQPAVSFKQLYPSVLLEQPRDEARIQAERIKYDERAKDRRAEAQRDESKLDKDLSAERREAKDRRQSEPEDMVEFRERHARVIDSLAETKQVKTQPRIFIYIAIVLLVLLILSFEFNNRSGFYQADCSSEPVEHINWMNCDKIGSDISNQDLSYANLRNVKFHKANLLGAKLVEADLSYSQLNKAMLANANLRGARLKGANLSGADLHYANLENTDLSFADLSNANIGGINLSNAILDNAIWIDGRVCKQKSLGKCIFE